MRWVLYSILLILLAVWAIALDIGPKEVPWVRTVIAETGPIHEIVTATGRVVSQREVEVRSPIPGKLTGVYVNEGGIVTAGNLLALLDDREALSVFNRAEANAHRAQEEEVQAERRLERARRLFEVGGEPQQAVEDAEDQLMAVRAKKRVLEEELHLAKMAHEKLRIVSPFEGIVTSRQAQEGEWVNQGALLFTVIDPNQLQIEAEIDSGDSGAVAVGQTVLVSGDAFPEQTLTEQVIKIAPAVSREGTTNTISVRTSLGPQVLFRIGQQVDVKIQTRSKDNALKLPFGAITTKEGKSEGKSEVAVVRNGRVRLIPVVLGVQDFTHIEIVEGLRSGEQVILPEGRVLSEGDRVEPVRAEGPP